MSRYKGDWELSYINRFKPTRREIRAAIDLYKPLEGGFMAIDETKAVYTVNRCWWTFKGRKFDVPQHTCNAPATAYTVTKNASNTTQGIACTMYLCDTHREKLKGIGYSATKVTCPPSHPYAIIAPVAEIKP